MLLGSSGHRPIRVVVFSFICAACLNIFPLGLVGGFFQPDWVALVLIYWCLWDPERMGAGIGWVSGMLLDALDYAVLGKHALAKTVCGFLSNKISLRLRTYPVWQQSLGVAILVGVDTLVVALVQYMLDEQPLSLARWMTPFSSMLMWPLVLVVLHKRPHGHRYGP